MRTRVFHPSMAKVLTIAIGACFIGKATIGQEVASDVKHAETDKSGRLESGTYILTLDIPAMEKEGPVTAHAKVTGNSEAVTIDVSRPSIQLKGRICNDGKLRLSATAFERNRVVTTHFIGKFENGGVSGKVHFVANGKKAFSGNWSLHPDELNSDRK